MHIADWGRPSGPLLRLLFLSIRWLDGWENTRAHALGELPALIAASGFGDVGVGERFSTVFGTLELLSARPV